MGMASTRCCVFITSTATPLIPVRRPLSLIISTKLQAADLFARRRGPQIFEVRNGGGKFLTRTAALNPGTEGAAAAETAVQKVHSAAETAVQKVHSIEEFEAALRAAQDRLVVVEYVGHRDEYEQEQEQGHEPNDGGVYSTMVQLSRKWPDVKFVMVDGDESDATRALCQRERAAGAADTETQVVLYRRMVRVHEEHGAVGPDTLLGDVLYYGGGGGRGGVVQVLQSGSQVAELVKKEAAGDRLVVVDVGLRGCRPCVRVYPTVVRLAQRMADSVVFARLDGDESEECMQFLSDMGVVEVPTFLFIRHGRLQGRYVGSSKGDLIGELLRYQGVRVT